MKKSSPRIGILGLGIFGRCWLHWLSTEFEHVETYSRSAKDRTCESEEELVSKVDIVFCCVPIGKLEEVLKKIASFLKAHHTVADVCSVKVMPVEWMQKHIPAETQILATHPMFGPQSAAHSLNDLSFFYSVIRGKENEFTWLLDFLQKNNVRIVNGTPEEHDRMAAETQALSFFVGRLLERTGMPKTPIDTTQYQDLCTFSEAICKDTPELFHDMIRFNPFAKQVISHFVQEAKGLEKEQNKMIA